MEIQVVGPVCATGYGVVTTQLVHALTSNSVTVRLVPLGRSDWSSFSSPAQSSVAAGLLAERLGADHKPDFTLGIWHEWDHPPEKMDPTAKTGTYVAMPTFELDRVRPKAVQCLNRVKVLVSSEHCRSVLSKHSVKAQMIHFHGVDTDVFPPALVDRAGDTFRMLNVGKLELRKGHDICIRVLARLLKQGKKVELWGMWDNPFFSRETFDSLVLQWVAQAATSEGLTREALMRRLLLVSRKLRPQDVAAVMAMCDLGLYPYRAEGWNLPLLETMACGLPVVATNVTGPRDFLNSSNAYLISGKEAVADDGIFFGPGRLEGNWYEPDFEEAAAAAEKAYNAWSEGRWELNEAGIRTAQGLSWTSAAVRIIRWLEQGCVLSS